jgi:hypothetical protein
MHILRNEKGMALPLVLIVMVVLFILGVALLQYATTEAVQVSRSEKSMQAYYLARSGAEAMAEHLINNPSAVSQYLNKTGTGSVPDSGGSFSVQVTEDADGNIRIESTGSVEDVSERLILTLALKDPGGIFDSAIYSKNDPALSALKSIEGNVSSNTTISGAPNTRVSGVDLPYRPWVFTEPIAPEGLSIDPINGSNFEVDNHNSILIIGSYEYSGISTKSNGTIVFDTRSGDLEIVVNGNLLVKGAFEVLGNNNVYLFLYGNANEMKTQDGANYPGKQMYVFLMNNSTLTLKTGNREFKGFIYGPNATVNLENADPGAEGAIIAGSFSAKGQPSIKYSPPDISVQDLGKYIKLYERWHYSN